MQDERAAVSQAALRLSQWMSPFLNVRKDDDIATALGTTLLSSNTSSVIEQAVDVACSRLDEISDSLMPLESSTTPLISVQHLRVVYTAVELVWEWGMRIGIRTLSKFDPPAAPLPNAILVSGKVLNYGADRLDASCDSQLLYRLARTMHRIVTNDTFSGLMLQRNLDRLLLAYMTLSQQHSHSIYALNTQLKGGVSADPRNGVAQQAKTALQALTSGPFSSAVVTKLRSFTKGPPWLRDASLSLLSSILQSPGGLEIVLSGYLEGEIDFVAAVS